MRVAIIDDDETMRAAVGKLLTAHGHSCAQFANGRQAVTALQRDTYDLIFVDWNMPGMSGIEVMEWARANLDPCPGILMMTSRSEKDDVVAGLASGADDFIIKPEADTVILARVEALARRFAPRPSQGRTDSYEGYAFDNLSESVTFDGETVQLTSKEFALAKLFFENLHRPLSRPYLLGTVWNSVADLPTRTLDVHVSRIRSKLQLRPERGYRLQTVFGFGYRLETFDDQED